MCTGKSFSEALILESVNPQYDDRLFIHFWIQYKKNTSWEHVVYKHCFEDQNKKQCLYTTCSEVVFFLYWSQESMNNLSSYCGLIDWRMSASDTDLPVIALIFIWIQIRIPKLADSFDQRSWVLGFIFLQDVTLQCDSKSRNHQTGSRIPTWIIIWKVDDDFKMYINYMIFL